MEKIRMVVCRPSVKDIVCGNHSIDNAKRILAMSEDNLP